MHSNGISKLDRNEDDDIIIKIFALKINLFF